MTTTNNLRKTLDHKQVEMMTPSPVASAAGVCVIESTQPTPANIALVVTGASAIYQRRAAEDAYVLLPASGIGGTFGAGACGTYHPNGPTGTASAGGASTITTVTTANVDLTGYRIRITAGTGAGQERVIASNTWGANSVITVSAVWTTNPDATSVYLILSGRFWIIFPAATPGMKYWDHCTQAWSTARVVTGLTHAGTDGRLVSTPGQYNAIATGTATAGGATTLTNSGKSWTTNQWTNFQVRITGGTGGGQVRTIASNTGTVLTVSASWTTNPDATSTYTIEGNDDYLYFVGNNATAIFRYSISGDSWSTMTARGATTAAGATWSWICCSTGDAWTNENAIINGRRIYSFRGGATTTLDYYDIPSNTWTNVAYPRAAETFTTGSSACYDGENYLYIHKDATGRFFRFDVRSGELDGWFTNLYAQGAAVVGDKIWRTTYVDGATTIKWIEQLHNTSTVVFRVMVI